MDEHLKIEERIPYCSRIIGSGDLDAPQAGIELAKLYAITGDYQNALASADAAMGRDANDAFAERELVLAQMGRYDDAITEANDDVKSNPQSGAVYANRCRIRAIANREPDQALADCNQAMTLENYDVDALDARALLYLKLGKFEEAATDAASALRKDHDLASAQFILGDSELHLNQIDAGNADIARAAADDVDVTKEMASVGVTAPSPN